MATIGFTAKLEAGTGSSEALEIVSETAMIGVPPLEVGNVENVHLNLVNGVKEHIPGLVNNGVMPFECNYDSAIYTKLAATKRTVIPWKISSPTGEGQTFSFSGFLTKLDTSFEPETLAKMKGEVQPAGAVTLGTIS